MTDITLERASWKLGDPLADGAGGFGRVYRGIAADGSVVAIKLVPKDPGASRELLFDIPEAEGIVPVLDRGEWGDHYVIVMPMAKESLRHFLQNKFGPVPFDEASNGSCCLRIDLPRTSGKHKPQGIGPQFDR